MVPLLSPCKYKRGGQVTWNWVRIPRTDILLLKRSSRCLTWSQHIKIGQCRHSTFSLPGQGALGLFTHMGSHKYQLGLKAATGTRPTTSAYFQLAFIPITLPPNTELLTVKSRPEPIFLVFTQAVFTMWSWPIFSAMSGRTFSIINILSTLNKSVLDLSQLLSMRHYNTMNQILNMPNGQFAEVK